MFQAVTTSKQTLLHLSLAGLIVMLAAVMTVSFSEPSSVLWPVAMIAMTLGAGLVFSWRLLIPAVLLAWFLPALGRSSVEQVPVLGLESMLELAGLAGVGFFTAMIRHTAAPLAGKTSDVSISGGLTPQDGILDESHLRPFLESEIARSRRFSRDFALVLAGVDERRQRYDYRDMAVWHASLEATGQLLRQTRQNVDRVFRYGPDGFALILPEAGEKEIPGLVRRLRRLARGTSPREGEPGGPLPIHFGATFYPECATTIEDLLRRAGVALRLAGGNMTRYQLDGAEAPELPPAESLRRDGAPEAEQTPVATGSPQAEAGEPAASEPEPAAVQPGDPVDPAGPDDAPERTATSTGDDIDALLRQMNETLEMIRSARNQAA